VAFIELSKIVYNVMKNPPYKTMCFHYYDHYSVMLNEWEPIKSFIAVKTIL